MQTNLKRKNVGLRIQDFVVCYWSNYKLSEDAVKRRFDKPTEIRIISEVDHGSSPKLRMQSSSFVFTKAKRFLLLCLLTLQLVAVASDGISESHVAEYFIQRRQYDSDIFSVVFKHGCTDDIDDCNPSRTRVSEWCQNLSAYAYNTPSPSYGCSCKFDFTFLPDVGKCVRKDLAPSHFGGSICKGLYLTKWDPLFFKTFDLGRNGKQAVPSQYENCTVISGSPMYYNFGLKIWVNIARDIFRFGTDGRDFMWKADKEGKLAGRIIRLNVTCKFPSKVLSCCLFFKALGNITYCRIGASFAYKSVCPITMNTSTAVPLSSWSPLLSPLSSPSSLSLSSSQYLLPSLPTRTRLQTHSFLPSKSQSILPAYMASSTQVPSISKEEIIASTKLNSQTISNQIGSRSVFIPVRPAQKPSKSLAVSTSTTLPPSGRDPGGGAGARTGDGNNGAVIGAAAGGAVAFVALTIILLVIFYKRRNQKRSKDGKTPPEVKNPVYGRNDNDIHMTTQTQRQAIASKGKDNQSVYQSLTHGDKGSEADGELYVNPDSDYDNHPVYQSLERQTAETGTPVYQSLQIGTTDREYTYAQTQPSRASISSRPKLDAADKKRKRSSGISGPVTKTLEVPYTGGPEEPMFNVLEESDSVKGSKGEITVGKPVDIQEPLYNELESEPPNGSVRKGLDAEQNYDASADMVDEPTGAREPLYNVLEGEAPESPHDSLDPLYSVLDEPDRGTYEPAMGETGQASARRPVPLSGLQNPTYERTEDFEISTSPQYASVESSGPRKESLYQPLKRI